MQKESREMEVKTLGSALIPSYTEGEVENEP